MDFLKGLVRINKINKKVVKKLTYDMSKVTIKFNNNIYNINDFNFNLLKDYYIYIHYHENVIFYVGKGSKLRYKGTDHRNNHWINTVNKYGFNIEIIKDNLNEKDSFELEKKLISKYGRIDLKTGTLVNLTDGGEGLSGIIMSKYTRNLHRISMLGDKNNMYNVRVCGKDNPNYGNTGGKNPLSKKIIAIDFKGNIIKKYDSIIDTKKDGYNSDCVSDCCRGKRAQTGGMQFIFAKNYIKSKLYIYIKGKTSRKAVVSIKDNIIIAYYESASEADKFGFSSKQISRVCNKKRKSHKGFNWMFFDELPEKLQNELFNKDIV